MLFLLKYFFATTYVRHTLKSFPDFADDSFISLINVCVWVESITLLCKFSGEDINEFIE